MRLFTVSPVDGCAPAVPVVVVTVAVVVVPVAVVTVAVVAVPSTVAGPAGAAVGGGGRLVIWIGVMVTRPSMSMVALQLNVIGHPDGLS